MSRFLIKFHLVAGDLGFLASLLYLSLLGVVDNKKSSLSSSRGGVAWGWTSLILAATECLLIANAGAIDGIAQGLREYYWLTN